MMTDKYCVEYKDSQIEHTFYERIGRKTDAYKRMRELKKNPRIVEVELKKFSEVLEKYSRSKLRGIWINMKYTK